MTAWSAALPVLRRIMNVQRLAQLVWAPPHDRESGPARGSLLRWGALVTRLRPRRRANCLERSLILYRFLSRAGAEPRLVLGVAHQHGAFTGHAWVTVDGNPVIDRGDALEAFAPVLEFGAGGLPLQPHADELRLPRVWR